MDINNLKHVVGKAETGKPAIIRFFSSIDEYSVREFNDEFLWLQDYIKPSKIVVMINSEGGSILHGMSTYSIISSCPIEVDCIIEGIAASMASVIWASGTNLYMHDYSLLMIHNPWCECEEDNDPSVHQTIEAFRSQIATIYKKRFGLTNEEIDAIMTGKGGADGTFFTAKEAVKAGFISDENIIKTSKKVRDKVKNKLHDIEDIASIRDVMTSISAELEENKLLEVIEAIHNRKDNLQIQDQIKMEKNNTFNFDAISAQLGLTKDTQAAAVEARIAELINTEAAFKETQNELTATKIKLEGKEAELANMLSELAEVKDSLKAYKDAEQAALEAEINSVIDNAIAAGKINASAKDAWNVMAHADFATVKTTLASIHARDVITEEIANTSENIKNIENTLSDVEAQIKAAVKEKFGDVKFDTF